MITNFTLHTCSYVTLQYNDAIFPVNVSFSDDLIFYSVLAVDVDLGKLIADIKTWERRIFF